MQPCTPPSQMMRTTLYMNNLIPVVSYRVRRRATWDSIIVIYWGEGGLHRLATLHAAQTRFGFRAFSATSFGVALHVVRINHRFRGYLHWRPSCHRFRGDHTGHLLATAFRATTRAHLSSGHRLRATRHPSSSRGMRIERGDHHHHHHHHHHHSCTSRCRALFVMW